MSSKEAAGEPRLVAAGFKPDNIVLMHDAEPRLPPRYLPEAKKIREELQLLLAQVEDDDSLVVALAGHGVQFKGEKRSFFCPVDAKLDEKETLIALDDVYRLLEKCPATRKLMLVDACRNDPVSELARSRPTVDLESVTRPQTEPVPEGLVALFSCREGQKSFEHPDLKHGIFFHSVLQGWNGAADANRDGQLTLDELAGYAKLETQNIARRDFRTLQNPHQSGDFSGVWVLREFGRSRGVPYDPSVHRRLPLGLRAKPGATADASGWPMEVVSAKDSAEMVFVPPGRFQMGTNERPDDGPIHEVQLGPYYIDKFEVTNRQFRLFAEETKFAGNSQWLRGADQNGVAGKDDHPVVWVSWDDAAAYARWSGKQLPTEAQWERAARHPDGPFPWGDALPRTRCNAFGPSDGFPLTAPVGKFAMGVSPVGCFDLAGNVAEWCRDWRGPYPTKSVVHPTGPPTGTHRVLRGGSWDDDDDFLFTTSRLEDAPTRRADRFGFRCVFELPEK